MIEILLSVFAFIFAIAIGVAVIKLVVGRIMNGKWWDCTWKQAILIFILLFVITYAIMFALGIGLAAVLLLFMGG